MRQPDFNELLRVLECKAPSRPTIFEFSLNHNIYNKVNDVSGDHQDGLTADGLRARAFGHLGYDFLTTHASDFRFPVKDAQHGESSRSMNLTSMIHDRASFEAYPWPNPDQHDYSRFDQVASHLLPGMKIIIHGPMGVLEHAIALVGYEDLCYIILDDPALAKDVFDAIGSRLYRFYELGLQHPLVGAAIVNDDWGFATQTMLSPDQMRKYVFPWHKRIVELIHKTNRPAILHSCGQLEAVWEEIIEYLEFDGKHSYEDKILPVEEAYERYGHRIAILGGMDLDFVCRRSTAEIQARSKAMLERT
ncbi:MAG: hypothetical protein HC898_01225, partial [Phycisphaerales bacterium]|nr:hypothetical protein [Phycisphaerales bacterium]